MTIGLFTVYSYMTWLFVTTNCPLLFYDPWPICNLICF